MLPVYHNCSCLFSLVSINDSSDDDDSYSCGDGSGEGNGSGGDSGGGCVGWWW